MNATSSTRVEISPCSKGRLLASLYLATIIGGVIAQGLIGNRLVDLDNAARTAAHIAANRTLYQLAFTVYMLEMVSQISFTLLFYDLLRPVNRSVARIALVIGLAGCVIKTFSRLFYYAPLFVTSSSALAGFSDVQQQALSLVMLRLNDYGAAMAMVFFGFESMLQGWLIVKSKFLPQFLGVFSMIAGFGWLAYIWPPLGYAVFMIIAPVALIGSLLTIGWLFVKGVDEQRWHEQVQLSGSSIWW